MKVAEFINEFKTKKIQNTQIKPNGVKDFICSTLEVKTYIPFMDKRKIAETIVNSNIEIVNGIKKYDNINSYIGLIVATLMAHTNLEFGEDPIEDYDLLAESGLLQQIIAEFKQSYDEVDVLLKMVIAYELEDNNLNVIINQFLNGVLEKLDGVADMLKNFTENVDLSNIFGADINKDDIAKLTGFLDKLK